MADLEENQTDAPKKKSKLPLMIGVVLALILGGGGFFAMYSGMLSAGGHKEEQADHGSDHGADSLSDDIAFVPLDPLIISLPPGGTNRHLRFKAQLEVDAAHHHDVTLLMPRVLDVLNGYLRAVDLADIEQASSLVRLRAQMLRRIQIVTGEGRVRDLLITEFVLN